VTSTTDLLGGELELTGRIMQASNATFVGRIGDVEVVYKPINGEKPLWDFPDGCLAHREVAAHLVSEVLGWDVVPRTWLRDGPLGDGMVQLWKTVDPTQDAVNLVLADEAPPMGWDQSGWRHVFDGYDAQDRRVSLIHEDTQALRRMAVFDIVTNNADRKGGHVLEMPDGHRHGVDHGLTFSAASRYGSGKGFGRSTVSPVTTAAKGSADATGSAIDVYDIVTNACGTPAASSASISSRAPGRQSICSRSAAASRETR
jgi:uncharacterized repeat protein (TIGR03843 family)